MASVIFSDDEMQESEKEVYGNNDKFLGRCFHPLVVDERIFGVN